MSDYKALLQKICEAAATCKYRNTHEWMEFMASVINDGLEQLEDDDRVQYDPDSGEFVTERNYSDAMHRMNSPHYELDGPGLGMEEPT